MSSSKITQAFLGKISDKNIAYIISNLLRQEYADSGSAVKHIVKKTNVSLRTAEKWYNSSNVPKSAHLLLLAKSFPPILDALLELIERTDLLESGKPRKLSFHSDNNAPAHTTKVRIYTDKFVSINIPISSNLIENLNQRQLWFLGLLHKGYDIKALDITYFWKITLRTANRDLAGLIRLNLIHFIGANKKGRYKIK